MTLERGTLRGSGGRADPGCRSRQAAWRHASSQKRYRPCGMKLAPQNPQLRVIAWPLSLRDGVFVIDAPLALTLCQGPFETIRARLRWRQAATTNAETRWVLPVPESPMNTIGSARSM